MVIDPRAVASAPTTSTRGFCASGSSSLATRSRTTSPTSSSPSCSSSTPRILTRHQPVHQLARRDHHQRPGDLRHDAVRAGPGQHDLHRHGGQHGGRPARSRRAGQAFRSPAQPDHDPPGVGRFPRQHSRCLHPGQEMETLVNTNHEILSRHTKQPLEKIVADTSRDYFMSQQRPRSMASSMRSTPQRLPRWPR